MSPREQVEKSFHEYPLVENDQRWSWNVKSCLVLWLVDVQRSHLPLIWCSDEDYKWPDWDIMRLIGSEQDTSLSQHLIYYPLLPGTLNIWINAESLWVQCPTFIIPLSTGLTWAPKAQGEWVWVSNTKPVMSLETTCNSSKHPLGIQQGHLILTANPGS